MGQDDKRRNGSLQGNADHRADPGPFDRLFEVFGVRTAAVAPSQVDGDG
jgi:hypothetical protein